MGLFEKNPNEVAYAGEKKHWTDVIKNSGPGELLVWRQPEEDFNTNSTLIVMPGETAVFIKGGEIVQTFENGTYKLDTNNYPFISRIRNAFSGGISTFNCVVYFFRTAHSMEIKWGTPTKFSVRDKMYGIQTDIGAFGAYKVGIDNPALFLEKMVGNNVPFETQSGLLNYFENEYQGKIVSILSREIQKIETEILGIEANLDVFSEKIRPAVNEIFMDYGLKCVSFSISSLVYDNAYRESIESARAAAVASQFTAQATANAIRAEYTGRGLGMSDEVQILGPNYAAAKSADILNNISLNSSSGGMANAAQGMGMGMMAGGMVGSLVSNMTMGGMGAYQQTGMQAMNFDPNARFQQQGSNPYQQQNSYQQAPSQPTAPVVDIDAEMAKLTDYLNKGYISEDEFDAKRRALLGI